MKILLAEQMLLDAVPWLREQTGGVHEWRLVTALDEEAVAWADVIVTGVLPAPLAARAAHLRLVHAISAGVDGIALDALPPGVVVANTHHHGRSVAEYVVGATLALTRRLCASDRALRADRWSSPRYDPALPMPDTLRDRTAGLVGLGEIGSEVVRLLRAFDMRCVAVRRHPGGRSAHGGGLAHGGGSAQAGGFARGGRSGQRGDADLAWVGGPERLPDLCAESDVIVVTVPQVAETTGLLGAREFALMKTTALLVNVARGPVVDESALYAALAERRIAGAALDVWWHEPDWSGRGAPASLPFRDLDNVLMTPHLAAVTGELLRRRLADIAANVNRLAAGEELLNVVHPG